jgi:hypothetical protein
MLGLGNARPSMRYQQLNQSFQSDPRRILGQALMQQGASAAPVRTPLQGLGRLSSALVGAYLQRKAGDAQVEREKAFETNVQSALSGLNLSATPTLEALSDFDPLAALTAGAGLEGQLAVAAASRQPKAPVSMFDPQTRDVKLVTPGGEEQAQLETQGYRLGNPPDAPSGFSFNDQGQLQIMPGSDQAFARGEKLTKTPREEEKKFELASTAYREATDLAQDSSGASDAGLIYKFFSALDPGGRVTDQEAMLAQTSASLGQQFAQRLRQGLKSGLLAPETRQEIVNTMRGLVVKRQDSLQKLFPMLDQRLKPLGFTSRDYFPFYNKIMAPLPTGGANTPTQNADVVGGEEILTPGSSTVDPAITNSTDADLIGGLL